MSPIITVRRAPIGDPDRCVIDVYYRVSRVGGLPKPNYSGDLSAMSSEEPELYELIALFEEEIESLVEGEKKNIEI